MTLIEVNNKFYPPILTDKKSIEGETLNLIKDIIFVEHPYSYGNMIEGVSDNICLKEWSLLVNEIPSPLSCCYIIFMGGTNNSKYKDVLKPLYVGRSENVKNRLKTHSVKSKCIDVINRDKGYLVIGLLKNKHFNNKEMECSLISILNPLLNVVN